MIKEGQSQYFYDVKSVALINRFNATAIIILQNVLGQFIQYLFNLHKIAKDLYSRNPEKDKGEGTAWPIFMSYYKKLP